MTNSIIQAAIAKLESAGIRQTGENRFHDPKRGYRGHCFVRVVNGASGELAEIGYEGKVSGAFARDCRNAIR
jgi:hypothetical protein